MKNLPGLKYQPAIDALDLSIKCPNNFTLLKEEEEVYRVAINPLTHIKNFLPNVLFDQACGITYFDYSKANVDENGKCERCGASFHKTYKKAKSVLEHFSRKNKENIGYDCVAKGTLNADDGLVKIKSGHITLYEFNNGNSLAEKFKIVTE